MRVTVRCVFVKRTGNLGILARSREYHIGLKQLVPDCVSRFGSDRQNGYGYPADKAKSLMKKVLNKKSPGTVSCTEHSANTNKTGTKLRERRLQGSYITPRTKITCQERELTVFPRHETNRKTDEPMVNTGQRWESVRIIHVSIAAVIRRLEYVNSRRIYLWWALGCAVTFKRICIGHNWTTANWGLCMVIHMHRMWKWSTTSTCNQQYTEWRQKTFRTAWEDEMGPIIKWTRHALLWLNKCPG